MSVNSVLILLAIGLMAGALSGLVGIGGGIVIVPLLVYYFGMSQHTAQGTTLFMFMLPIGILGVYNYYQKGHVDYKTALIIATTFLIGSYFGSKVALGIDQKMLKRVFGVILLLISFKLISGK